MSSVTGRISEIKQPRGGYIRPSDLEVRERASKLELSPNENIHSSLVGLAVDYLSRYMMGDKAAEAFRISLAGANIASWMGGIEYAEAKSLNLLEGISGLNDTSIVNACKLATYDVWLRNPAHALRAPGPDDIMPDKDTIFNIRELVSRCLSFWDEYGPIISQGFTFEPDGYTKTVNTGDGDFLTKDTMWDLKVSKSKPTSKHTLQIMMYWIMGQHSGNPIFSSISRVGFFNPRSNTAYLLDVIDIDPDVIKTIERDVICYKN